MAVMNNRPGAEAGIFDVAALSVPKVHLLFTFRNFSLTVHYNAALSLSPFNSITACALKTRRSIVPPPLHRVSSDVRHAPYVRFPVAPRGAGCESERVWIEETFLLAFTLALALALDSISICSCFDDVICIPVQKLCHSKDFRYP
jgi:hypothetical protein